MAAISNTRITVKMKNAVFITAIAWTLICAFEACHKDPAPVPACERIEGVWRQTFSPHSIYSFSDGACNKKVIAAGTLVYENDYGYQCDGDTIYLVDLVERTEKRWTLKFTTDTTVTIRTDGSFLINLERWP